MNWSLIRAAAGILGLAIVMRVATAEVLEPLAVSVTDPTQTSGLSVAEIALPADAFYQFAETFYADQWQVVSRSGELQQLYFSSEPYADVVFLYGLVRMPRANVLDIYYAPDWEHYEPAFTVVAPLDEAQPGPYVLLSKWAGVRNSVFSRYVVDSQAESQLLRLWMRVAESAYGVPQGAVGDDVDSRRQRPWTMLNAFSLFSGEAAIQETLQQQLLESREPVQVAPETISELSGPDIVSHPYDKLLGDRRGGDLPLARLTPPARYFVYSNHPAGTLDWLDRAAAIGFDVVGLQQKSYLRRELIDRYLARLHLTRAQVRSLSALARRLALFGPDLFLTDGSHITLLVEIDDSPLLDDFLSLALPASPGTGGIRSYGDDPPAYFARHGQFMILSTSREEAAAALALAKNGGRGSLGESAEFRYMLTLLSPPTDVSGMFIYFSDPFIRAMVGPRKKIAQLRRQQARTRLHLVTAAALLYEMDQGRPADLDSLLSLGYVEPDWLQSWEGDSTELDSGAIARSRLYGTLAQMTPLQDLDIVAVDVSERDAYQAYVQDYSRFWRTYFDPIAVRIDIGEPLRIETLILPLVQNSIYEMVEAALGGEPVTMALPEQAPQPITTLSVKVPHRIVEGLVAAEIHRDRIGFRLLERLGDSLHIALYDNDPLVVLGSADLLGAFSGVWLNGGIGSSDFLYWGLLGSLLTQPLTVFAELENAEDALDKVAVEDFVWDLALDSDFGEDSLEQLGEDGSRGWVYTLNLEEILRFHLYIQRLGKYLAVSNRPFNFQPQPANVAAREANARLHIDFGRIEKLAPTLYLHQMQRRSSAEMKNIGRLLPFMLLGMDSVQAALERHRRIYGSVPAHAEGGEWIWRARARDLESSVFGSLWVPKLPSFYDRSAETKPTGLLDELKALDLRFRFEKEGARIELQLTPK